MWRNFRTRATEWYQCRRKTKKRSKITKRDKHFEFSLCYCTIRKICNNISPYSFGEIVDFYHVGVTYFTVLLFNTNGFWRIFKRLVVRCVYFPFLKIFICLANITCTAWFISKLLLCIFLGDCKYAHSKNLLHGVRGSTWWRHEVETLRFC